ncbi:peptide chain release factor-like protein [Sphingomonas sp. 1P06PA]|uniref:peptide chain release factor-like protein n=1 Tax=Sphingomonas sp. 1P06PA TaxID=554121 RepID=UPI0039A590F4
MTGVDSDLGEILIEVWPPRQTGGQICGPGSSGIKITHLASGIVAICETERSQHVNKMIAVNMIEAAITHPRYRGPSR